MQPMIGEVRIFAGNFAPRGWAFCQGQLISISENTSLFSILGTTYGGDGRTTFGLPDLRGRTAIGEGTGAGLTSRPLGQKSGTQTNNLTVGQMPAHNHVAQVGVPVSGDDGTSDEAGGLLSTTDGALVYGGAADGTKYNGGDLPVTVGQTGSSQAVNNVQPSLALNYIVALVGIYPSRS